MRWIERKEKWAALFLAAFAAALASGCTALVAGGAGAAGGYAAGKDMRDGKLIDSAK